MKILAILAALAALAGCAGVEVPKEVAVAVPVPCVDPAKRPAAPAFRSDAELDGLDDYRWAWAVEAERLKGRDYSRELEALVEGCSRIPALPAR